jgi:hypothetical protein
MPNCIGCAVIPEDCECVGPVRCYNDATLSVKLVSGVCQPPISVQEKETEKPFNLYPNPASEFVHIQSPINVFIELLTVDGNRIFTNCTDTNNVSNISTANIANGAYLMRATTATGMRYYQLLQVVH